MRTKRFLLVAIYIAITFTFYACSSDEPIGGNENNNNNNQSGLPSLYCDFGPVTQYGGGCFPIANASECDTQWGRVVSVCSNNNGNIGIEQCAGYCKWPSGCFIISTDPTGEYGTVTSSCAQAISNCQTNGQFFSNSTCSSNNTTSAKPNAITITLTSWEKERAGIIGSSYAKPKISFIVMAFQNEALISIDYATMLEATSSIATWTGSVSKDISFNSQADYLRVIAEVIDVGLILDTDISPGYFQVWRSPLPAVNFSGSSTMDFGEGKSKVTYNYKFIRK